MSLTPKRQIDWAECDLHKSKRVTAHSPPMLSNTNTMEAAIRGWNDGIKSAIMKDQHSEHWGGSYTSRQYISLSVAQNQNKSNFGAINRYYTVRDTQLYHRSWKFTTIAMEAHWWNEPFQSNIQHRTDMNIQDNEHCMNCMVQEIWHQPHPSFYRPLTAVSTALSKSSCHVVQ